MINDTIVNRNILVTGGAGYIASHMVRRLLEEGYNPIIIDNLSTGHKEFIPKEVTFIKDDLRNEKDIKKVSEKYTIDTVMHFAASALVSESISSPIKYYENNVSSCINLLNIMIKYKIKRIIFSSTCAIYGEPSRIPITEDNDASPISSYGRSKLMIEQIL